MKSTWEKVPRSWPAGLGRARAARLIPNDPATASFTVVRTTSRRLKRSIMRE